MRFSDNHQQLTIHHPRHPPGMRPNTTAAVAPNNEHGGGGFTGLLGGLFNNSRTGSQRELDAGLDDDDGFKRPQTSAAVMGHRDNQLRQQQQTQQSGGGGGDLGTLTYPLNTHYQYVIKISFTTHRKTSPCHNILSNAH